MAIGKILCLGDSLTAGLEWSATGYRSYRGPLQKLLSDAGYTVDFVGTVSDPPASGGTDPDHNGYGGARMDSSDSADNSIEGRVSTIRAAVGPVDIIILMIGWNDVYSATASVATKHADLLDTIQAGDWASAKVLMATLSPEPNKTAAQTGSDYANYAAINAAVRGAVTSDRDVADLAALTTGGTADRDAMVEKLLFDAATIWEVTTDASGATLPSVGGGHFISSFKSIQDFNANWRTTVAERRGMNSFTSGLAPTPATVGHPTFVNSVRAIVPWLWVFAGPGHASSNTVVEARNLFAQARRGSNGQWEFFFEGARLGVTNANSAVYGSHAQVLRGFRDELTSYYRTGGGANIESWAEDTVPSRDIVPFYGGYNRSLLADATAFCVGVQVRLALLDPNGPNDIAQSRFVVACGFDAFVGGQPYRYDYWGWPLDAMDGGHDRWQILRSTDWTAIGSIPMDRGSGHYEDPATPPPHAYRYTEGPYQYNDYPTYSPSAAEIRANPPRLPRYWAGAGSSGGTSAWVPEDYWYNPSLGGRDIHWTLQGAERAGRCFFDALVRTGWLSGFGGTGGGGGEPVIISPLPGLPARGAWFDRFVDEGTTPDTATWGSIDGETVAVAPSWGASTALGAATVGVAYSGQLVASGTPTPTYSIISGAPGWLSCSSAGALSGTPTGDAATFTITFRATNSQGSADVVLSLALVAGVAVTTVSLPNGVQNQAYLQPLAATGVEPFTWSVISGSLPTGVSLAGATIAGTPTAASGTSSFTVQVTDALGRTDTQALSITLGAASAVPVITTSSLPAGTVGASYSQTITATGTASISFAVVSGTLPTGLSLNGSTGALTGTPTAAGAFGFTVRATNAYGFGDASFSVVINAVATAPVASPWGRFVRQ